MSGGEEPRVVTDFAPWPVPLRLARIVALGRDVGTRVNVGFDAGDDGKNVLFWWATGIRVQRATDPAVMRAMLEPAVGVGLAEQELGDAARRLMARWSEDGSQRRLTIDAMTGVKGARGVDLTVSYERVLTEDEVPDQRLAALEVHVPELKGSGLPPFVRARIEQAPLRNATRDPSRYGGLSLTAVVGVGNGSAALAAIFQDARAAGWESFGSDGLRRRVPSQDEEHHCYLHVSVKHQPESLQIDFQESD